MTSKSGASFAGSRRLAGAIAATVLLAAGQASAQALWGGANLGDSPSAVTAAFPQAQPTTSPNGVTWLETSGLTFLDEPYSAVFAFEDGTLAGVSLISPNTRPFDPAEFKHSQTIAPELARLYGGEPVCEDHSGIFAMYACDWTTDGLHIHFGYFEGTKTIVIERLGFSSGPADWGGWSWGWG